MKKECAFCQKKFYTFLSRLKNGRGKYCSNKCIGKARQKGPSLLCFICQKKFHRKPSLVLSRKTYCSNKCYGISRIGKKHTEETKQKTRGNNSKNWKGGISMFNQSYRQVQMQTPEYKNWRKSVFKRDDYTCQDCGQVGKSLQADHIKPWALYPDLRLAIDNGRTLCVLCHRKTETWGGIKSSARLV